MTANVAIIDYGMGNLASVERAFAACGATIVRVSDPAQLSTNVSHLVLPGVGAFARGMQNLRERGWYDVIRERVLAMAVPLLGICLGMHLLASRGEEGGDCDGLNLIPGRVTKLIPVASTERIPHVGWNELHIKRDHPILANVTSGQDVYFVHSYHFVAERESDVIATTPYCGQFASIIGRDELVGVQFHPEKSSKCGLAMIKNFIR